MKVVVMRTGGVSTYLHLMVIREPNDWNMTYTWTMCIRDSSNATVFTGTFYYTVGRDPDVMRYVFNVGSLPDGVYKVDIYNWSDCNPTMEVTTYSYYIHKVSNVSSLVLPADFWSGSHKFFILYAYNGKLFWIYDENISAVIIPKGIPIYAEITDSSGNAFVDSIVAYDAVTYVEPNMRVPFMATYTIKVDQPKAGDIVSNVQNAVGFMYGATVQQVDDYTIKIIIAKTEPGIDPLTAAVIIMVAAAAIAWAFAWSYVRVQEINLQAKALDTAKPAIDVAADAYQRYINDIRRCRPDDKQCIDLAQYKWFPVIQGANALVGKIISAGLPAYQCNGLNIGGACIPWWVVGIMVFVAGLMVISALK